MDKQESKILSASNDQGKTEKLPSSLEFLFQLGIWLGGLGDQESPVIAAVVVPTRRFAAAIATAGIHIGRCAIQTPASQHIEHLSSFPENAKVQLMQNDRMLKGSYLGIKEQFGKPMVGLMLKEGYSHFVALEDAWRICLVGETSTRPSKRTVSSSLKTSHFLQDALKPAHADRFIGNTRSETVLIGPLGALVEELSTAEFAFNHGRSGSLGEIVRARRTLPASQAHRCTLLSTFEGDSRDETMEPESIVVFDGSTAYSRWEYAWAGHTKLAILEGTDPNLFTSTNRIHELFSQRQSSVELRGELKGLSRSVDSVIFRVAI